VLVGHGVSQMGSQICQVAVAWQLYLLTHSALSLGLLGLVRFLPISAMALVGGVTADAFDRRRLLIAAQVVLGVNSLALAVVTWTGHATPAALYAFIFMIGLATAFEAPARQALIPNLVPAEDLPRALSLNVTVWQVATVLGPSIGGGLLAWLGPGAAYAVDSVSFLAMIVALAGLEHRAPPPAQRATFGALGEGLRFIIATPAILWLMVLDFLACFFGGSMLLMPIFADQLLGVGVKGLGLLYAAPPLGAVVAAIWMANRGPVRSQGMTVLVSVLAYGVSIAAFGASRHFVLSLAFLAASGAADTVSMVVRQTVRALLTPDALRGRMTSVNMLFFMGGPFLGETEAGLVAKLYGAPFSVISGGLLCAAAALALGAALPILRNLEGAGEAEPEGRGSVRRDLGAPQNREV
jgi:MFS family permease